MPKMKTHRATAKRLRVTGNGIVMKTKAGRRHKLGKKTSKRKMDMRKPAAVGAPEQKRVQQLIPYK